LSGGGIGIVCDTPSNITPDSTLTSSSIKLCPAGNDTITDFTLGNTATKSNADTINLSDLLIGYSATSNLSDFVTAAADGAHTKLTIDHDGSTTCTG
jgi:hypothetical protein